MATKDIPDIEVVRAAADYRWAGGVSVFVNELLADRTGQPLKVCDRAIERAVRCGLVDFGVSARTCWPTTVGLVLLDKGGESDGEQ